MRYVLLLSAMLFTLASPMTAWARGKWVSKGGTWYYTTTNGVTASDMWVKEGGSMFRIDENGAMMKDCWFEMDRKWYYLGGSGAAASGWQEIDGKWYFFHKEDYTMATEATIDSWYVGPDGAWDPSK